MQAINETLLRETHNKRMDDILNLLSDISLWYSKDESTDSQVKTKAFAEFAEKLRAGEYTIVMVGEFSAGKSTLLNALMGENLLPAYTNETTATVNFLRHTKQAEQGEKGCVFYNDETRQLLENVDSDIIKQYVSTKGEDVAKKIAHLDLYFDSEFLCDNVTLIDSPGLNGVAEGHADITYEQIMESHACIFVFNAAQPGSKSNFEFLTQLKNNMGTILFVLNRIDEINASEGDSPEAVIVKIQENYRRFFPDSECPEIWPLAAKPALVSRSNSLVEYRDKDDYTIEEKATLLETSRIQGFETRLMEFLTKGEKTKRQSLEPVSRTIEVGSRSKSELENEIKLLEKSDDTGEIEKNIMAVQDAIKSCETKLHGCYSDVSSKVKTGLRDIIEAIDADINRYTDRAISELNTFGNLEDINEYLKSVGKKYAVHVKSFLEKYDAALRDGIIEQIFANYHTFAERIQEGFDGLDTGLSISVELNTKEYTFNAGLAAMEQQEDEVKQQLETFRLQEEQANKDKLTATLNTKRQKKLEEQLREITEQRAEINGRIMPAVVQTTKKLQHTGTFKEVGLFGKIGGFFGGQKMIVEEVPHTEDSAYRAESTKQKSELEALAREKAELVTQLDNSAEKNLMIASETYSRIRVALDRAEEKYLELIKENREKFQVKYNAQIQKARNELRNLLGDKTHELISEVKRILRSQERKYISIVNSVIMANLKQSLSDEQKKQESLKARLNSSKKERDERIAMLTARLETLSTILERAMALKNELERLSIENVD